jgi:hypothetical protein
MYEYQVISADLSILGEKIEGLKSARFHERPTDILNAYSQDGWDAFSVSHDANNRMVITFRREMR